jgi:hypothetical protein
MIPLIGAPRAHIIAGLRRLTAPVKAHRAKF